MTSLAEIQKAGGEDVHICLVRAAPPQNQYMVRFAAAGIPVHQLPLRLSKLVSDWDTREAILGKAIARLYPFTGLLARLLAAFGNRPRSAIRASIEGRIRTILGGFFVQAREKPLFLLLLTWHMARRRDGVLHLHGYGTGLNFVLHWAQARGIGTVYQEHSTPDLTTRRWAGLPRDINTASMVVAVSEAGAVALRELCGVTRPITVIPPIPDMRGLTEVPDRRTWSGTDEIQILTVARLSEEKGLTFLIQAAAQVLETRPNIRFKIYGEGPLRETLQSAIESNHLQHRVALAGSFRRNQLAGIANAADIFVLSSLTEGFPLSIIEAMAWQLPIVATCVGGVPEILQDRVTALLCPPGNPDQLAQAILHLVNDPTEARRIAAAANSVYHSGKYSADCLASRYKTTYTSVIQMSGGKSF